MNWKIVSLISATLLAWSVAGESHAGSIPFYYNVDSQLLPGGPIELEHPSAGPLTPLMTGGYQVTLSGDAVNQSATQTFDDVLFLNQFDFPLPAGPALSFSGGSWSGGGDTLAIDSPSGFLPMTDTDAPQSFTLSSFTANLAPTDAPPYVFIGDIAPLASVPFSFTVDLGTNAPFDLYGSFVSTTPVPEPSALILAVLGAIGLFVAARHRKQLVRRTCALKM
jgi:hypothetical protein